jgi:peptide/nickel transport system substrate-binding protein
MIQGSKRVAFLAAAGVAALGLAACSSNSSSTAGSNIKPGGTLKIVAGGGPTFLDTVPAYYTANYQLERVYARQLLSYPTLPDPTFTSSGWTADVTPVPDVATAFPTVANGGLSADGLTYTFHIKSGVMWDSSPPRQVTSTDFLREFKTFCNTVAPVGNLPYYSKTIVGLAQYCAQESTAFAKIKNPTAAQFANFQNTHSISGITTPSPSEIQFHMIQKAGDFPFMLAMPFASARPVEADSYLPGSTLFDQHIVSDGPYKITSYVPSRSITFAKNPTWKQSTDPVRHQYVNAITVTMGVTDASTVLADLKAGKYDMSLDVGVLPSAIPQLIASHDPKFAIWPYTSTVPYVAFNLRSPNVNHAISKLALRQAIEYGINKVAVAKVLGGSAVVKVINSAIPPGNAGYVNYNPFPTPGGQGAATSSGLAKCKQLLAQAGFKNGVTLNYGYQLDSINSSIFQSIQASLHLCGINLHGQPESGSTFFTHVGNVSVTNKPGTFDMAQVGWIPDWFGTNNGRTVVDPFFRTNCVLGTINYGCFSNAQLDSLLNQAEGSSSPAQSDALYHQVDVLAMQNAVIVPLIDSQAVQYTSKNLENGPSGSTAVTYSPNIGGVDLTNVWLKNG